MATAILLSDGNQNIYKSDAVLTAVTSAGDIVALGTGVAGVDEVGGAIGDTVALSLSGRWSVSVGVETVAVGDLIYFDGTDATGVSVGNALLGVNMSGTTGDIEVELGRGSLVGA